MVEHPSERLTDIQIARRARPKRIEEIAALLGLAPDDLDRYGDLKAKVRMGAIRRVLESKHPEGRLILVSAITPTTAGEGKTTTTIGLTQALRAIGKNATAALREPSLGPCLGMKGGAAGGGYAQVLPMEDINLHFTGDLHAVTTAHNLIAAALDNHVHFGLAPRVAVRDILWRRVVDMNDRSLRNIVIGLGGDGFARESGFDITAASEIMAALCLSSNYAELKAKIGNILLGLTLDGNPFFVRDLKVEGACAALLRDALLPNLAQTLEGGPVFIHGGPFANIAQGTNSILATKLALKLADYVVTEAGFGFDLGGEKYLDLVAPYAGFRPACLVLVASVRALKLHGGVKKIDLPKPDPDAVLRGAANLEKHVENAKKFGLRIVVAINRFPTDSDAEIAAAASLCERLGTGFAVSDVWARGGPGGEALARAVLEAADAGSPGYKPIYDWSLPVDEKIITVAKEIYGAKYVHFLPEAKRDLEKIKRLGFDRLPVCIAKTQYSFSDDPTKLGRPEGFNMNVRSIVISSGAGFLVPLTGELMRMPGLPRAPQAQVIDLTDDGEIVGLS